MKRVENVFPPVSTHTPLIFPGEEELGQRSGDCLVIVSLKCIMIYPAGNGRRKMTYSG